VNSHELHIHNSVLRDGRSGSIKIDLHHSGYNVELDLNNITVLNGVGYKFHYISDISVNVGSEAYYLMSIQDCYIGHSEGAAISIENAISCIPKVST